MEGNSWIWEGVWQTLQEGRCGLVCCLDEPFDPWGNYIELSVNGVVRLSLVDGRFNGRNVGGFLESAEVALAGLCFHTLEYPLREPN